MVVARFQVPGAIDIGPGKFKLGLHVIEGDATCEYLSSTVQTLYNEALLQTPDDPKAAWTTTKHRLLPQLQALARTLARFRRGGSEQERADHSRYGAALRSRIDPSLAGPSSIFIRLRKVRASDLIPSLTVNDVVLPDPNSMLGAASDYLHSWWKALRKIRRVHSDAEDTAHLLSLGSLPPGVQVSSATHSQLNNRSASCVMCLSEAPESLPHLAVGCPFARRLWAALSPSPHPIFADFVCPLVSRSERRLVELRVLFFHSIWKLSRRRRFSSQPPEPITETEFEELGGSIQGCTGRLASL
ncbi:BQ2448_2318 [Microbotryum intermedium]|uniref:BQ2448_2316 protein n=1 Tax=Microbotryum intermedium TaxID=269621 RepID=A0A238FDX3_9BASI|nr:BQ2448_2316 [Microbotryum intermedium]SCV69298.1 BQ2448_2318 [Microbotryum intermedium]